MKITLNIEIPDEALRNAVESQVGIALATMTADAITKKADEVIKAKFDRFDAGAALVQAAMVQFKGAIDEAIADTLGRPGYQRREKIDDIVKSVALEAIKGNLK